MYMGYTQKSIYIALGKLVFKIHEHGGIMEKKLSSGLDADSMSQTDEQICPPHKDILTS